ncbi:HEAT repeat domain-containing protein [Yinghuangia aomiensis]
MDLPTALAGLDAHPWSTVDHAYGPAEDLPGLLRAFAEGGPDAGEALNELYGSIVHQGTVYAASVHAAPYLARIAACGRQTVDALGLLGCLAESEDEHDVEPGAVRAAVAAQLPLLIPLLADEDPAVRQTAGRTIGHTRDTRTAPAAVRARLAAETDPAVRAELLTAYSRLDRTGAAAEARTLLGPDTPAPLRLAAVLTALDAGEPWLAAHRDAVLALLPTHETAGSAVAHEYREPLLTIVGILLGRDTDADRDSAFALLDAALRDPAPRFRPRPCGRPTTPAPCPAAPRSG